MVKALIENTRKLVELALREDLHERGDITTDAIAFKIIKKMATVVAKEDGILCGLFVLPLIIEHFSDEITFELLVNDGDSVKSGDFLLKITGNSSTLLKIERTFLNFLGRLSGIATLTNKFVKEISHTNAKILDTRKTTPGWRLLEKYAVKCGGGTNHRIGLYDMFLIKENHIAVAGGLEQAVDRCQKYMQNNNFSAKIDIEVQNIDECKVAATLPVDQIMLDNMSLKDMRYCVEFINGKIPLEASGNVNMETVKAIAETGVDYISIGALTHSAKTFDVTMLL